MKSEAIAVGIAGVFFGLLAGWIIGSEQAGLRSPSAQGPTQTSSARASSAPSTTRAAVLDQAQVNALTSVATRETSNPRPRVELANLYFDAERYSDAIQWYVEALKLNPNDIDVNTDLGVCYYYTNEPDKALEQFDKSLRLDPSHVKTLLNVGIVRAFGKQDLQGAAEAWRQVLKISPDSPEGQAAKRALDSLQAAHPGMERGGPAKPDPAGESRE